MLDLNSNIVEVFCSWVKDRPEHTAVIEGNNKLSFAGLFDAAKALAARLWACGTGKGDVVLIIGKRSSCFIEEVLAVLMTGAAFTSVDEAFPRERQETICGQVNARVILKDRKILDAGRWMAGSEEPAAGSSEGDTAAFSIPEISPEDMAYIHFTSGTEGVPKGVKVQHRGSVLRTNWAIKEMGNDGSDVILVKTNLSFVASIVEITRGIMTGSTMVILPQSEEKEPAKYLKAIGDHKVSFMSITPTMLSLVISEAERSGRLDVLDSLRLVECAGEAFRAAPARYILKTLRHTRIVNIFGQTETSTILSAWHEVTQEDAEKGVIPVGLPPEGVSVYVTAEGKICGPDEPGEICVGDLGLSLGYIDEELTKKAYVLQKFEDGTEGLLYHTGDRGQWRSDGVLLVLGRKDSQVKIHGQRVELGDVENAVSSLPDVKECTVTAVKNRKGDDLICAYVVKNSGEGNVSELRDALSAKLPEYMLPSYFVFMDELPRNVNGKVDKSRLPRPETARTTRYEPPRNEVEEKICSAFEKAFGAGKVGIRDSLYELGSDSLTAISLYTLIEDSVGKDQMNGMQVSSMMRAQTPENIAKLLIRTENLCREKSVNKDVRDAHSQELFDQLIRLRDPGSSPCRPVATTVSNRIMLRRPGSVMSLIFVFDKSVSLDEARRAVSQVMKESVFEYTYDKTAGCFMQYSGVRDDIPVLDITEEEAGSAALALVGAGYPYDGSQLLSDVYMIENGVTGEVEMFLVQHHSINDRESTEILLDRIGAALKGESRKASHAVYSLPAGSERETMSAEEYFGLVEELDSRVKDHPYTRKAVSRVLDPACFADPVPVIMDMYLAMNPLLADMKKVPLALIINGRNAENADEIGCFLSLRYSVYEVETHTLTDAPDVQPVEETEKLTEWVPVINYIGIFPDARPREEVFAIQKGYEKARYLHGSRLGSELVLKLPVYE